LRIPVVRQGFESYHLREKVPRVEPPVTVRPSIAHAAPTQRRFLRLAVLAAVLTAGAAALSARAPFLTCAPAPSPADPVGQAGASQAVNTGLVLGRVVDGGTDRPVAGATVILFVTSSAQQPAGPTLALAPQQVVTGGDGFFVFRDLPRGDFTFRCLAPGYLASNGAGMNRPGGPSRAVSLGDGQKVDDVVVRMWRPGAITGEVVDDHGEAVEGVMVSLLKIDLFAGRRRLLIQQSATTDDRGAYRFAALVPGDYAVCALFSRHILPIASNGGGSGYRMGDLMLISASGSRNLDPAPDEEGHLSVFRDSCHPGAPTVHTALPITVESGQERSSIGLTLGLVPTSTVRGTVTGPPGRVAGVTVHLLPAGTDDSTVDSSIEAAYTSADGSGAFGFVGVPAGSYTLKVVDPFAPVLRLPPELASQMGEEFAYSVRIGGTQADRPTLWATAPVDVGETDVNGVVLALREGARVSGQVAFDGTSERPVGTRLTQLRIGLVDPSGQATSSYAPRGQFEPDGRFAVTGIVPDVT